MVDGKLKNINKVADTLIFEKIENNSLEVEADSKYNKFSPFRIF